MAELAEIEHRHLRDAIEFAVAVVAESQKRKTSLTYPEELKTQIGKPRVATRSLGRLRRGIERDDQFREKLAIGATPELVGEIGFLWLRQPPNWEADATALAAAVEADERDSDLEAALRKSEKRRVAAEQVAVRTRTELVELHVSIGSQQAEIDSLRTDLIKADDRIAEMSAEVIDVRNDARHARDREASAVKKLERALADVTGSPTPTDKDSGAEKIRVLEDEARRIRDDVAGAADTARSLAEQLSSMISGGGIEESSMPRPAQRVAMSLPGGLIATSAEAALFFIRSDAEILIDGYNVAMLGWPKVGLEMQRLMLLDAVENLVRRFKADVTVVFDGASIVGAHTDRRRLVRVMFSPEGVTADDVIRDEVRRLPTTHAIVVVTNDAEIVRDVRVEGVNTLPSNALLAVI